MALFDWLGWSRCHKDSDYLLLLQDRGFHINGRLYRNHRNSRRRAMVYFLKRRASLQQGCLASRWLSSPVLTSCHTIGDEQIRSYEKRVRRAIEARDRSMEDERLRDKDRSLIFRIPFLGMPLAFSESVFKVKGAMSRGNNHHHDDQEVLRLFYTYTVEHAV